MTACDTNRADHTKRRRLRMAFVIGAVSAGVVAELAANDWFLLTLFAAFCGGFTAAGLGALLGNSIRINRSRVSRTLVCVAMGAVAAIAAVTALAMTPSRAFKRAFGLVPPPQVARVDAVRRYAGGPGDMEVFVSFRTDRVTLESVLSVRGFRRATQELAASKPGRVDTAELLKALFPLTYESAVRAWQEFATANEPEVYQWRSEQSPEQVNVVYDADSSLAVACYLFG